MSFRLRKLRRIAQQEGSVGALRFLSHDLYYRFIHLLAFPLQRRRTGAPGRDLLAEFAKMMVQRGAADVLEIGARAVSDRTSRDLFPPPLRYTGFDLHAGPNVDVVGDAHELTAHLPENAFDGVFSISVFEHLLMPWKVVLEINRVLKPGGIVFVGTHPCWPPHELPWDFWRYQPNAFWALFNASTGFELLATITDTPARILPAGRSLILSGTVKTVCPMSVTVLARKVGPHDPRLSWPVTAADATPTLYPTA